MKFIVTVVMGFLIFTNFEYFLNVFFDIYEALLYTAKNYPPDYLFVAVIAAFCFLAILKNNSTNF